MLMGAIWVGAVSSGLKAWVVVPSGYVTESGSRTVLFPPATSRPVALIAVCSDLTNNPAVGSYQ